MSKTKTLSDFTTLNVKQSTADNIKTLNVNDITIKGEVVPVYQTIDELVSAEIEKRGLKNLPPNISNTNI